MLNFACVLAGCDEICFLDVIAVVLVLVLAPVLVLVLVLAPVLVLLLVLVVE